MSSLRGFVVVSLCILAGAVMPTSCANQQTAHQPPQKAQFAKAIATPDRRDLPEPLSPGARAILKQRMTSHARDMRELVSAVMLLRYATIAQRADAIAADASLRRPVASEENDLSTSPPERFFVRQDELKVAARALGDAARALEPYRVANAYGKLSEGCVECHADYRPRD